MITAALVLSISILLPLLPEHDEMDQSLFGPTDALFIQYRLLIRDLLGRECIFQPSCSRFAEEAISEYGPVTGSMMALDRWTRCNHSATRMDSYTPADGRLMDLLEPYEGNGTWDCMLLPF